MYICIYVYVYTYVCMYIIYIYIYGHLRLWSEPPHFSTQLSHSIFRPLPRAVALCSYLFLEKRRDIGIYWVYPLVN